MFNTTFHHGKQRHGGGLSSAPSLLTTTLILPALLFYFGLISSFASGVLLAAVYILLRTAISIASTQPSMYRISSVRIRRVIAIITLALMIHLLVAITWQDVDFARAIASLVLLVIMLVAASQLASSLMSSSSEQLHGGLLKIFSVLSIVALIAMVGGALGWAGPPTKLDDHWRRPVFPFSEPATFALAFIPILMYTCTSTRGILRFAVALIGLACSLIIENLTFVCGVVLVVLVTLPLRMVPLVLIPFVFASSQIDLTYFTDRVDMSGENRNLSSLVYQQGWQMIGEAMERSGYFGLGFQQLGTQGTEVVASQVIRELKGGEDQNLLDGGFLFSKLGAEFGAFGILATFGYLIIATRALLTLRSVAFRRKRLHSALILSHASIFTYGIEMFVRGAGYFSGTSLLFLASLWIVLSSRQLRPD